MINGTKKYAIGIILSILVFFPIFPQLDTEALERRLHDSKNNERLHILVQLVDAFREKNPLKSIQYGEEGLRLLELHPDRLKRTRIYSGMCLAYLRQGNFEKSKKFGKEALAMASQLGSTKIHADALYNLGKILLKQSDYNGALTYTIQARRLYLESGNQKGTARSFFQLSVAYWQLCDYSAALDNGLKASSIFEKLGDEIGIGQSYNAVGAIYWKENLFDKALAYFILAENLFKRQKDMDGLARAQNNIAAIFYEQKKYTQSLQYFKKSLKIKKDEGDSYGTAMTLLNIGRLLQEKGDYSQAIIYYNRSLAISKSLDGNELIRETLIHISRIERLRGNNNIALKNAFKALEAAKKMKAGIGLSSAYLEISEVFSAMKNDQKALEYFKKYKEVNDAAFSENKRRRIAELQSIYDFERKEKEIELLKKKKQIQQLDLARQKYLKITLIIISALVCCIAFIVFARFRLKVRVTRQLQEETDGHRQTTLKLRESEEMFRTLAEKSEVGIFAFTKEKFLYINPKMAEIFGHEMEELKTIAPLDVVVEEDKLLSKDVINTLMKDRTEMVHKFRIRTKKGDIVHLESYGVRSTYKGKTVILGTLIDISDRKRAESELLKSRKLESVGILAGSIAHDFNNMISIIMGNITTAVMETATKPNVTKMLKRAQKASTQAADLVQKLVTFSEGGWVIPHKVITSEILAGTLEYYPELKPVIREVTIPTDLRPLCGDERQLRQVMYNLLQNAVDAVKETDPQHVTLCAENVFLESGNRFNLETGEYVRITVTDNGKGIPPHQLENIFDPYFSTKETVNQQGMGLSLAICYSIIKKHNGYITVESEVEKGTSVYLYLPAFYEGCGKVSG